MGTYIFALERDMPLKGRKNLNVSSISATNISANQIQTLHDTNFNQSHSRLAGGESNGILKHGQTVSMEFQDGSGTTTKTLTEILSNDDNSRNYSLGSQNNKFGAIFAEEAVFSADSVYIADIKLSNDGEGLVINSVDSVTGSPKDVSLKIGDAKIQAGPLNLIGSSASEPSTRTSDFTPVPIDGDVDKMAYLVTVPDSSDDKNGSYFRMLTGVNGNTLTWSTIKLFIRGSKGVNGTVIKGKFGQKEDLPTADVQQGDTYIVDSDSGDDAKSYMYIARKHNATKEFVTGQNWEKIDVNIRGSNGANGSPGANGTVIKGRHTSTNNLPTADVQQGDTYIVDSGSGDDAKSYMYIARKHNATKEFVTGQNWEKIDVNIRGSNGANGSPGANGTVIKGRHTSTNNLPTADVQQGDTYIVDSGSGDDAKSYMYIARKHNAIKEFVTGQNWEKIDVNIRGPKGNGGNTIDIVVTVNTINTLGKDSLILHFDGKDIIDTQFVSGKYYKFDVSDTTYKSNTCDLIFTTSSSDVEYHEGITRNVNDEITLYVSQTTPMLNIGCKNNVTIPTVKLNMIGSGGDSISNFTQSLLNSTQNGVYNLYKKCTLYQILLDKSDSIGDDGFTVTENDINNAKKTNQESLLYDKIFQINALKVSSLAATPVSFLPQDVITACRTECSTGDHFLIMYHRKHINTETTTWGSSKDDIITENDFSVQGVKNTTPEQDSKMWDNNVSTNESTVPQDHLPSVEGSSTSITPVVLVPDIFGSRLFLKKDDDSDPMEQIWLPNSYDFITGGFNVKIKSAFNLSGARLQFNDLVSKFKGEYQVDNKYFESNIQRDVKFYISQFKPDFGISEIQCLLSDSVSRTRYYEMFDENISSYMSKMIKSFKNDGYSTSEYQHSSTGGDVATQFDGTLSAFSYNWLQTSASHIAEFRKRIKLASGYNDITQSPEHKINLVTHSFGGIIVKAYLNKHAEEGQQIIKKWVTMGTPWLGITDMTDYWTNNGKNVGFFDNFNIHSRLDTQFPMMYDLLPAPDEVWEELGLTVPKFHHKFNWNWYDRSRSATATILTPNTFRAFMNENFDKTGIKQSSDKFNFDENFRMYPRDETCWYDQIYTDIDQLHTTVVNVPSIEFLNIVGTGLPVPGRTIITEVPYREFNMGDGYKHTTEWERSDDGDGTVSTNSAVMHLINAKQNDKYVDSTIIVGGTHQSIIQNHQLYISLRKIGAGHTSMVYNDTVISLIKEFLNE